MKKYISLMAAALMLVACNSQPTTSNSESKAPEYDRTSLSIIAPTGAPALAFYNYAKVEKFETNSNPAEGILPLMVAGKKDVVVLPTNAGMQAIINKKAEYQIAATITFGNFYIASMGNDADGVMNEGDKILLFQKGNVPDKIFHYVYGDAFDSNVYYVSAVSDAAAALIGGSFVDAESGDNVVPNYVMIAEPALTNVLSKKETVSVYADMQAKYKEKSGNKEIFQASVFVKNSLEKALATSFLSSLKEDIEGAIAEPSKLSEGMNKASNAAELFGVAPAMAENVLKKNNGMGLGFKYAKENKEGIENFLSIFGITGIDEEIYL